VSSPSFNTDFDFGFSLVTENDLAYTKREVALEEKVSKHLVTAQTYKDKLNALYNMIIPLLKNLQKDPEKEYILWPNRVEKIDQFITKINNLIDEEGK
jgi:hypothetical protein